MKEFSIGMALFDFIPVICFMLGAIILQRDLYSKMSKGAFALFAAGTIDVICAGSLKALYKLLYALGICDFEPLNTLFFPLQSIGFLLAGISIIAMLFHSQGNAEKLYSAVAAPVLWKGTMLFVGMMILGLGCMNFGLAKVAVKRKKISAAVLFVISFIFSLGMGYLSTKTFEKASMNWIAEFVNVIGQGSFLLGTWILHKSMKENK